jgi:hypothetical protein
VVLVSADCALIQRKRAVFFGKIVQAIFGRKGEGGNGQRR